jgi:hypothetical protein
LEGAPDFGGFSGPDDKPTSLRDAVWGIKILSEGVSMQPVQQSVIPAGLFSGPASI